MTDDTKVPTRTEIARLRHARFKSAIADHWQQLNSDVEMRWEQREGRGLEIWLRAHPEISLNEFEELLRHRSESEIDHRERPARWIGGLEFYIRGPLNRAGEPLGRVRTVPVRESIVPMSPARSTGRSGGN